MNEIGLNGIEFIEYSSPNPEKLHDLFTSMGFSRTQKHKDRDIELYQQNMIAFLLNKEPDSASTNFNHHHGPCASAMGWRVRNPKEALAAALKNGATECTNGDHFDQDGNRVPAIVGIGESVIYLLKDVDQATIYENLGFETHKNPTKTDSLGLIFIDHLTNNVPKGELNKWTDFYKGVFGFEEVRYFDIRGEKTGLRSFALRSPCGHFCIPINEGTEDKSQINEYLEEYKGPGIQHIALASHDIVTTIDSLRKTPIKMLDIDDSYYEDVFDRVPNVTENRKELQRLSLLVDGDDKGYLLQIFTKNAIGPIFYEIIQRKNHFSFGEGNFGALFRSIEKDQEERGYFEK